MNTHKTILVGIDYSIPSINALKEAVRIAATRDLRIIGFHILNKDVLDDFYKDESIDVAQAVVLAREKLNRFIQEHVGTEYEIDAVVKIGNPFEEIIRLVKNHNAQTLILGSHGLKTPYLEQVGPLAARCVRMAPVEVLLIRDAQNKPFNSIGACIDFSENSISAAHRAAEIAKKDGAVLRLVHVYRPPFYADSNIGWLSAAFPKTDDVEVQASKEKDLKKLCDELVAEHRLENISFVAKQVNNIAKGLYDELKSINADLVVLGTRGRTGVKAIFLGTTAESLIQTTPCSTLAVKPKDFTYEI